MRLRRAAPAVMSLVLVASAFTAPYSLALAGQEAASPVTDGAAPTEAEAVAEAQRSNKPVQVSKLLSGHSEVRALPSGMLEQTIHSSPVRVFKDGKYVAIDTRLTRLSNGDLAPAASPLSVVLSGGGDGPFARLMRAGRELTLTWPYGKLPTPAVDGDTATYAEVFTNVDLVVRVSPGGAFSHVLVVKTAEAARLPQLAKVQLKLGGNLEVEAGPSGAVSAKDAGGAGAVFESDPATMWDSGTGSPDASPAPSSGARSAPKPADGSSPASSSAEGPGETAEVAPLKATVSDGQLTLQPDQHLLTDPNTRFPVFIDPRWHSPGSGRELQIRSDDPDTFLPMENSVKGMGKCDNYAKLGNGDPVPGMYGYCGQTHWARLLFQFPIAALAYQNIVKAEFSVTVEHSADSTPRPVSLYRTRDLPETPTWNNAKSASFWFQHAETKDSNIGYLQNQPGELRFNGAGVVKAVSDAASNGAQRISLGLRAKDEATWNGWKKFRHSTGGEVSPQLQVLYNLPPERPPTEALKAVGQGYQIPCVRPADPWRWVTSKPTQLEARMLPDPNNDMRQAEFQIGWKEPDGFKWRRGAPGQPGGYLLSPPRTSPPFVLDISKLDLPEGKQISWRVRAHDFRVDKNNNPDLSPVPEVWMGSSLFSDVASGVEAPEFLPHACSFAYDEHGPGEPNVTSEEYPRDKWSNEVGRPGNFRIIKPAGEAPAGYQYQFVHAREKQRLQTLRCPDMSNCVIRNWAPTQVGDWTLHVWAFDQAGNGSVDPTCGGMDDSADQNGDYDCGATHTYSFRVLEHVDEKAWWALDDDRGGTTLREVKSGNPATIVNTGGAPGDLLDPPLGTGAGQVPVRSGRILGALTTRSPDNGVAEQYAQTSGPLIDPAQSYAVSAWAKPDAAGWVKKIAAQDGAHLNAFGLEYLGQEKKWSFTIVNADRDDPQILQAKWAETAEPGQWTHLVGVHNAAARTVSLYVDGHRRATATYPAGWLQFTKVNAGPFTIGRGQWQAGKADGWSGKIDDVHVFGDDTRVDDAYVRDKLFKPTVSARWKLNQAGGSPLTTGEDEFNPGQAARLYNGAAISANTDVNTGCSRVVVGKMCLRLDGDNDYAATAGPVVRTDQSFTIAGWALLPNNNPQKRMAVFAQAGTSNSAFTVRWNPQAHRVEYTDDEGNTVIEYSGRWEIEMPDRDVNPTVSRPTATSTKGRRIIGDDRPDHLALTYDAASRTMRLYVNGEFEQAAHNVSGRSNVTSWYSAKGSFLIGASKTNGTATNNGIGEFFSGAIDDVWVYRGVLPQTQLDMLKTPTELATREGEPDASFTEKTA